MPRATKPQSNFKNFTINQKNLPESTQPVPKGRGGYHEIRILDLANGALLIYSGLLPLCWPYSFVIAESARLPWHDEYWTHDKATDLNTQRPVRDEVEARATQILSIIEASGDSMADGQVTYGSAALCSDQRTKVQSLAVETLIVVDRCLSAHHARSFDDATEWLPIAYERLIDATMEAVQQLGNVRENARKAALVRHAETAAMKQDVFAWCDKHLGAFKSLERATAELVRMRLVPVSWRTIRDWLSEYKRRSARKP